MVNMVDANSFWKEAGVFGGDAEMIRNRVFVAELLWVTLHPSIQETSGSLWLAHDKLLASAEA